MNWLLVIVLIVLLFCAVSGARRGCLRVLFSLISWIILIAVVGALTPSMGEFLIEKTALEERISERVAGNLQESAEESMEDAAESGLESAGISLPEPLQELILEDSAEAAAESGIYEEAGERVADVLIMILAFLIVLILGIIIISLIGRATKAVNRIPVIGKINRVLGFFAGGFKGLLIVWILFLFISIFGAAGLGETALAYIDSSAFLTLLYENNLILTFIAALI